MIERQTIDGKDATVAYLSADFTPVDADKAELIKIIYDDGNVVFATPMKSEDQNVNTPSN
jgi:hypothetical protein